VTAGLLTDRDALLGSVLASPEDDAPRLVYADYLEENGEADRARFIRRQIHNARNTGGRSYVRTRARDGAFSDLVRAKPWEHYRPHHVTPMLVFSLASYARCVAWYRGFPAVVACSDRQWHRVAHLFPGPVAVVAITAVSGAWGVVPYPGGVPEYVSLIRPAIRVRAETTWAAYPRLWPNVARFRHTCGAYTLGRVAAGRLP
jgi:uncharacterized protein (TIGR02996 family)